MKTEIVKVNDIQIECPYHKENQQHYVAMKPICEALGIDFSSQLKRTKRDYEFLSGMVIYMTTTGGDGKQYSMACLPLKYVFGWLFTIDEETVKPEAKNAIKRYKIECYDALYQHFTGIQFKRTQLLLAEKTIALQLAQLNLELKESEPMKKINELKLKQKQARQQLTEIDENAIQGELELVDDNE